MGTRGRKSAAELAMIRPIRPPSAFDRPSPARQPARPPAHLTAATKRWYKQIAAEYGLEDHALRTLQTACECWDLAQQARAELAQHGLTYTDAKGMVRSRPEATIAAHARTGFLRAMRELKLDIEPPNPPRIGGIGWMPTT